MNMKKLSITYITLVFLIFSSCGKKTHHDVKDIEQKNNFQHHSFEGLYQAIFLPINKSVTPDLRGSLTIAKYDDDFAASVRLSKSPGSSLQMQNIHIGQRCPEASDDLNGDELIDAFEGARVFYDILIPLDDDLNSQRMGSGIYPVSDTFGHYTWSRESSFSEMIKDLNDDDLNLKDDIAKLNNLDLNLEGKIIIISGIPSLLKLPDTVSGKGRFDPHSAFPIACGVIKRITKSPGKIDYDHTGILISEIDRKIEREDDDAFFESKKPPIDNYGSDLINELIN